MEAHGQVRRQMWWLFVSKF